MINLVMTKITFKVKSLRIQQNKEVATEFFLLADTWDGYSTRICTGSYDLCKIVKESIDDSVIEGKGAHRLDIRSAYDKLRQRDIKAYQPLPAEQLAILSKVTPTPAEEVLEDYALESGIVGKEDYERVESRLLGMLSSRPGKRNTWGAVSIKFLANAMKLTSDETECLDRALKKYCEKHNIHTYKSGNIEMYQLPFKGNVYESLQYTAR